MKDPFVSEVREFRMAHTKQFNSDLHLICEDLRRFESTLGPRVVTLQPRKSRPTSAAAATNHPRGRG
jgi:hypothetical protein